MQSRTQNHRRENNSFINLSMLKESALPYRIDCCTATIEYTLHKVATLLNCEEQWSVHGRLVLKNVSWYSREVNRIEEERNVRVALETSRHS